MKRSVCGLITFVLCLLVAFSISVCAATYNLSDTDMRINLDDSVWYVFTRDNIKNNSELDELGLSYDEMYSILFDNNIYMDALLYYDTGEYVELCVRKYPNDSGLVNLSNYKEEEVLTFAKGMAKKINVENYSTYESQYKFAKLEYTEPTMGINMYEFLTIVNKDNYAFTFQSETPYIAAQYEMMEDIINSIQFDVDSTLKEPEATSFWDSVLTKTASGIIAGAFVGWGIAFFSKKKKKSVLQSNGTPFKDNVGTNQF